MPYYLTKVLPLLLMPLSVCVMMLLLALFLHFTGKRRTSVFCLTAAVIVLWGSSLPVVADRLLWSLERQHPPVPVADIPVSDCLLVLGGALGVLQHPRVDVELTDAADRVYQAAKLYRLGKARSLIVAAGNQPWSSRQVPEAVLIRDLLVEWGVPRDVIGLDSVSRNTRENAINSLALVRAADCRSNLLVTSAWHMPRALAAFEKAGLKMFPVSVDVRMVSQTGAEWSRFIPRADVLAATSDALHEWMGIWVYRWKGWN